MSIFVIAALCVFIFSVLMFLFYMVAKGECHENIGLGLGVLLFMFLVGLIMAGKWHHEVLKLDCKCPVVEQVENK